MRLFLTLFLILTVQLYGQAQVISESAAREELAKRGIDEKRLREELLKRGIDLDKIDQNNPQELLRVEKEIREVTAMLEKEGAAKAETAPPGGTSQPTAVTPKPTTAVSVSEEKNVDANKNAVNNNVEIKKAVKDGATVEEAITETIQEKAKAPDPTIYGQHLFRDKSLQIFRTTEDAKPSQNYILGPGDVIAITIWGDTDINYAEEINKDGYIQPKSMPRYYLAGLTIEAAKNLLAKSLKSYHYFAPNQIDVNVTTARTLNVNIFGEVLNSGTFNISALNTAINALVASGGPSDIGSVRRIKLMRKGVTKTIDIYKYLSNPVVSQDFYLQDNDYIHVPIAEKVVQISGAVNRPFRYELLENENLLELIKYAGGLTSSALKRNIQLIRLENDEEKIIDINLDEVEKGNKQIILRNGDIISIKAITENYRNIVSIAGAVEGQGEYAFSEGMKISDLVKRAKLRENALTTTAYLRRLNPDLVTVRYEIINLKDALSGNQSANVLLSKGDVLTVMAASDFIESKEVSITGAVRKPGSYSVDDNKSLKVSDLIYLSGGLKEDATTFGYIFRKKDGTADQVEYIYFDVTKAMKNKGSQDDLQLVPSDKILIYSQQSFTDKLDIQIEGAVRKPGQFTFDPSLTLRKLLILAEGLKMEAAPNRIDIYRLNIDKERKTTTLAAQIKVNDDLSTDQDIQLLPFDQIIVRSAPEFELQRNVVIEGEVVYPGKYALIKDNTRISDIIEQCGGLTDEAYSSGATIIRSKDNVGTIIIDLKEILRNKKSNVNLILHEGDVLTIPKKNNIVSIFGATNYQDLYSEKVRQQDKVNVVFEKGKNAMYYINEYAGGPHKDADIGRITVEHPNGKVEKVGRKFIFFKSYPEVVEGSVIKVPFKKVDPEKVKAENKEVDWGSVLKDSIAQAMSILSLVLLIQNLD